MNNIGPKQLKLFNSLILQEEHSLLTGQQIVLFLLSIRIFFKSSVRIFRPKHGCHYKTIYVPFGSECFSCRVQSSDVQHIFEVILPCTASLNKYEPVKSDMSHPIVRWFY